MKKKLEEMSLEELWQLFPIFLVEHKSEWKDWYESEKTSLKKILGANVIKRIEHIGSTAIPNIWAKNIVDILLEVGLHLRMTGDHDEIYFRDYLCQHPDIAQAYQELKLSLWKKFEHNRDGYTDAKTDFINHHVSEAKSSNFQESEKFHQKSFDRRKN